MAKPYSKQKGFIQRYKRTDNNSGVTGVSFNSNRNRWDARLIFNSKVHYGKAWTTKDQAVRSRLRLEFDLFGIDDMPQREIIPEYFKNVKNRILIAYLNNKNEKR